jgi:hypothetical protein
MTDSVEYNSKLPVFTRYINTRDIGALNADKEELILRGLKLLRDEA